MGATVKIMLSYDYCHFEVCKSTDENITDKQVNEMRKDVQRLADEAVRQYKIAKDKADKRANSSAEIARFEQDCQAIEKKPKGERTINEMAMLKSRDNHSFYKSVVAEYDYEDDNETFLFNH